MRRCTAPSDRRTATPWRWWTGASRPSSYQGGAQGRAVERPLRAGRVGLQRAADVEKQPATEFRVLQQGLDEPPHQGSGGRGGFPSTDECGEELQPSVRRRAAAGRGLHGTAGRETLLKLALPAPQTSGNAAGRLTKRGRPAAVRQSSGRLARAAEQAKDHRLIRLVALRPITLPLQLETLQYLSQSTNALQPETL